MKQWFPGAVHLTTFSFVRTEKWNEQKMVCGNCPFGLFSGRGGPGTARPGGDGGRAQRFLSFLESLHSWFRGKVLNDFIKII